jgi:hypothetical protein
MSSSWRKSVSLPLLAGVIAGAVVAYGCWLLVRHDTDVPGIARNAGRAWYFVLVLAAVAGGIVFYLARRLLRGASVARREWTLVVPAVTPTTTGYREAQVPSVRDLLARLATRGYRLTSASVDAAGEAQRPLDPRTPLAGAAIVLRDERLGAAPAGLVLRISERTEAASGLCTVEARDVRGRGYEELASFVIVELDALVPGVTYKPSDSALTPDPAGDLRAVLPAAPLAIAAR